jgi:YVTN family beta-propeller protein
MRHAAVALLLVPAMIAGAQSSAPTGTLVAANMNANTASVVDVATGRTLATLPTGEGPHEVAISNEGRWAVVSNYGNRNAVGHSLLVIDLSNNTIARTIELGEGNRRPHGMRFLPGDRRLVVTSEASQRLLFVDFIGGMVDTAVTTGQPGTHMVTVTRDGKRAFTTNIPAGTVSAIDLERLALASTFTVGTRIEGIAVMPNGEEVWVGGNESKTVYAVNGSTGAVVAKLEGFGMPYRIGITPDGRTAVISDPGAERVHIADVATHKIRSTIDVPPVSGAGGASPQGVTISRDGRTAFVTLKAASKVAVIDIASAKITSQLDVGGGSDGVGVSPWVGGKPGA